MLTHDLTEAEMCCFCQHLLWIDLIEDRLSPTAIKGLKTVGIDIDNL